jgi:hypothetical protein
LGLGSFFITNRSRLPLAAPGQAEAPRAGDLWRLLPAGCGSCARVLRGGGGGGGGVSGIGVRRTLGILLVLELALDNLGLGATAGALNPLDVLVILVGCQDCLQLLVCCLKESGFIWVDISTITLSC